VGGFVVFEGLDGAGKSTQIRLLADALDAVGVAVTTLREPGGTKAGEAIRAIMFGPDAKPLEPLTWAFLMNSARAQLVKERIRPALENGGTVLADRYWFSTLAYQAGGEGLDERIVRDLCSMATEDVEPDLVIYLDLAPEAVVDRKAGHDPNVLDRRPLEFHQRVAKAYGRMAQADPERWRSFDATLPPKVLAQSIQEAVVNDLSLTTPAALG
jgi:dTMP kinase